MFFRARHVVQFGHCQEKKTEASRECLGVMSFEGKTHYTTHPPTNRQSGVAPVILYQLSSIPCASRPMFLEMCNSPHCASR